MDAPKTYFKFFYFFLYCFSSAPDHTILNNSAPDLTQPNPFFRAWCVVDLPLPVR